ncbi:magnesium transporter [Novimethylophilus kurashikiensis]|uniref:Magnesium transporter n=1 Tax=Novimethylophilus kurashikiensis TaxID=1825523 RepID=A0A2R5F1Z4_9PROT|nr:CorA family divalent cation transporter [Novimethylophilus kurashikiensis]GBG12677.1 magnesium transporter [Novimethylophilus kurashikiensis]
MAEQENLQEHFIAVQNLLSKQKLVEELVHRQDMPRHDLVESLVHKQNLAELQRLIGRLPTSVIARILEDLSEEDRKTVWALVHDVRKDEILLEVSDDVRVELVSEPKPQEQSMMVRVFDLHEGRLRQIPIYHHQDMSSVKPIWVDLVTPEEEELAWAEEMFGVKLPNPKDLTDLETSARFYVEDNEEVHLHSDFLLDREDESRNVAVAFILKGNTLFSVRSEELPVFRLQRLRARAQAGYVTEAKDVLLDLYAADVEYSANALEDVYARLEEVGRQVFRSHMTNAQAAKILTTISEEEDVNGRIRRNVLDTRNALSFLMRSKLLSNDQHNETREILRDIESLDGHTNFLFNKINFQMDATVGFLNVNQNIDLKRLTIISVVFMPVNVLAGIGGMSEFSMMTHAIPWPLAYGSFIIAMIIIGYMTYMWLKAFEDRSIKGQRIGKNG